MAIYSLILSLLIVMILSFCSGIVTFERSDLCLVLFFTLIVYGFLVVGHIKYGPYICDKGNNGTGIYEADVILSSSESISSWQWQKTANWIGAFLAYEGAVYHKCVFGELSEFSQKDFFTYVLTKRRAYILASLCSGRILYSDYGNRSQRIDFEGGIPLKVVYRARDHFLKAIYPSVNYVYTETELELIREFNETDWVKNRDIHQRATLVYCLLLILLFLVSLLAAFLFVCIVKYFIAFIVDPLAFLYIFLIGMLLFGVFWYFQGNTASASKYLYDERNDNYISENVTLTVSALVFYSMNPTRKFHYIFCEEYAKCYKCFYMLEDRKYVSRKNSEESFYFVLTNEKVALLRELASIEVEFDVYRLCDTLRFDSCVPLCITVGKRSRVLKSIAPVEGYTYTEAQLAAIEKFNTLYP